MSDQFEDENFALEPAEAPAEVPAEAPVEPQAEPEPEDPFFEEAEVYLPTGSSAITFRAPGGKTYYGTLREGEASLPVREALIRAQLTIGPETEIWLNGAMVDLNTVVPANQVITLVGSVKGG